MITADEPKVSSGENFVIPMAHRIFFPQPKKVTLNSGINSVVMDEKMKARMERFKMEVK